MRVTRGLLSVMQWLLQTHPGDPALMVALVVTTEALPLNKLHVTLLDRGIIRMCSRIMGRFFENNSYYQQNNGMK